MERKRFLDSAPFSTERTSWKLTAVKVPYKTKFLRSPKSELLFFVDLNMNFILTSLPTLTEYVGSCILCKPSCYQWQECKLDFFLAVTHFTFSGACSLCALQEEIT